MIDALSEFFARVQLKGRLFYAGKMRGVLDLEMPGGTAFLHIVRDGGLDMVRPGLPVLHVPVPALLLCPSTCRYKLKASTHEGANIICAAFEFGASMGRSFPLGVTETIVFPFESVPGAMPLVDLLLAEFDCGGAGWQKALGVLFEYALIVLVRSAIERKIISGGVLYAMLDGRLVAALNAIHTQPEQDWSLEQLATICGMSRSRFAATFARLVGVSPIAYLTGWRMKLARDMLRQRLPIKLVASSVGYSSQAAFTRAFTHEIGLPPAEWIRRE